MITVLTSPGKFSCPQDCHYCPDERDANGVRNMPRSYISTEPACRRATKNKFDPVLQFFDRAFTLFEIGHTIDKIELLVLGKKQLFYFFKNTCRTHVLRTINVRRLGGTWSFYPLEYQEEFIRDLYYAANEFENAKKGFANNTFIFSYSCGLM